MSSLFGLDQSSRLVTVHEVPRGLACECRCVVCGEPLIARQGPVREHHFAHASGREACAASHETLLHRYAKQLIQEAGGLAVPIGPEVAATLGVESALAGAGYLRLLSVELERGVGDIRPDLLACTEEAVSVAIEVAYSSFCDAEKASRFAALKLPALEVDLRAFSPDGFDPSALRRAVVDEAGRKTWVWPKPGRAGQVDPSLAPDLGGDQVAVVAPPPGRRGLPERIVTISGRWVSIKEFPDGDITVKVVRFDPDVVSIVKTIARANHGVYRPRWKSWNIPRWRAESVRRALLEAAETVAIGVRSPEP